MLLKFEDIKKLWDREKHHAKKERKHRNEEDNDPLIHETHDPIHHSHEPEKLTIDPERHEIDPPTQSEIAAAQKLHAMESEAEDGIEEYLQNDL